jgi:drug/metabolite transporter (DMT)-like permease
LVDTVVSPIVAAFFGFLAFGEVPSSNMVYGGILLVVSGFWLTQHMRKKSIEPVTVNK